MNIQENERWSKRLFGKNGLFLTGISVILLVLYEVGKNILMDYVLSRLSHHGIVFNKVVEFVLDHPFLSSVSFFAVVLSALLILDYIQFQKRKAMVVPLPIPPISKDVPKQEHKKKRTFKQKQKSAISRVSKLVNDAVEKSLKFSEGISYQGEPNLKEQCVIARSSGKALMEYYKTGNNRQYFSDGARKNIVEIYETISICTQKMFVAIEGKYYPDLWDEYSEKLKAIKPLRDELDSEFYEFLVSFEEN